jgi:hypothetical protein
MIRLCATRYAVPLRAPRLSKGHSPENSITKHATNRRAAAEPRRYLTILRTSKRDNSGFPSRRLSAGGHYAAQQSQGLPR